MLNPVYTHDLVDMFYFQFNWLLLLKLIQMTSTERIVEYCNLDPEPESQSNTSVTRGWPKYGIITAEGASFAHHKSLPYVLKTMFFCIRASEKVMFSIHKSIQGVGILNFMVV